MAYSNPFPYIPGAPAPQQQQQQQMPQFNLEQFRQYAVTLNDQALAQFAQLARQQGISEADIAAGIKLIKSL